MMWNKIFWVFFLVGEAALVFFLIEDFSRRFLAATILVLFLGIWKLAEDVERDRERKRPLVVKVRRAILNKLK
jgi:hypothetical protein